MLSNQPKTLRLVSLLALLGLALAYPETAQSQGKDITLQDHFYQRTLPEACQPESSQGNCNFIRFTYQTLLRAPNPNLPARVNKKVYELLADSREASSREDLVERAEFFIEMKKSPEFIHSNGWDDSHQATIRQKGQVLSLHYSAGGYTGGAHPYSVSQHFHYDLVSGRTLSLDDFFKPGYKPKLLAIAEKNFRKTHGIKPNESYSQHGFDFPKNGTFTLSEFYAFESEGIYFDYDRYEIGPYVTPSGSFLVKYSDMAHLLKEDNLLGVPTHNQGRQGPADQFDCRFTFSGSLAKKTITMCFYPDKNDGRVHGHYYYGDASGGLLQFEGTATPQNDGSYLQRLEERNAQGNTTGFFIGKLKSGLMQGTWSSTDGSRSYPYRLTLQR